MLLVAAFAATLLFFSPAAISAQENGSCRVCSCQFNNIEVMNRMIEAKINKSLANDPVFRTLSIDIDDSRNRNLRVHLLAPQTRLASVSISNPALANTSSNNLLAYRPNYNDVHSGNSNLGVVFLNLNGIFPCVPPATRIPCGVVSLEEDAFSGGRAFLQAMDAGNNFRIFSSTENIFTYAMAVQGCPQLNTSCWPTWAERGVTCQLPRKYCG